MPNLKNDLINKLANDKFYDELELVRLASEPNMNYRDKIDSMTEALKSIAVINAQLGLVEEYFKDPISKPQTTASPSPSGQVHQGQSHGE